MYFMFVPKFKLVVTTHGVFEYNLQWIDDDAIVGLSYESDVLTDFVFISMTASLGPIVESSLNENVGEFEVVVSCVTNSARSLTLIYRSNASADPSDPHPGPNLLTDHVFGYSNDSTFLVITEVTGGQVL
jgi:hypothetical protein